MNYGFVIDNQRCIGCHACSTACKSENQVPLGVHRTWVKNVEHGVYPNVMRSFQVTRCNHCENPPCVRICPVSAMYQRKDGIVDFDSEACIGCKACLQACPYDAIHVDPETGTAAKCHYCAHRVETGLEPACVVVCPTHAIIAGDLDDPKSEISQIVSLRRTTVRKPEQGTRPKLLYVDGDDVAMHPTAIGDQRGPMLSSEGLERKGASSASAATAAETSEDGWRTPGAQGSPVGGPIRAGGSSVAEQMVQVAYDVRKQVPWHWQVPAYLVTKGIGAGVFLLMAAAHLLGGPTLGAGVRVAAGLLGIIATAATGALLVADLERPDRFLSVLLRPQWKSWLARGAYLLTAFSLVTMGWWLLEFGDFAEWFEPSTGLRTAFAVATIPAAIGAAIYTAFLFAQAEGRDLWQSPLLPFHLLVQATMAGAAALLLLFQLAEVGSDVMSMTRGVLLVALVLDLFVILVGEFAIPHASEVAAIAAKRITHGPYAKMFWGGAIAAGHVVPLALLLAESAWVAGVAGVLALVGLYAYEHAFVMAPQEVPNS